VLPVSLTVTLPDDDDAEADGLEPEEPEPELPQAASKASGTIAAAVHAKRILLATEEYSFAFARLRVRCTTRKRTRAMRPAL